MTTSEAPRTPLPVVVKGACHHDCPDSCGWHVTVHDGAVRGGVHAGYLHTHPAAHPHSVRRFVSAATKLAR